MKSTNDRDQAIKTALRKLWKTFRQQNQERIQVLERAITALETGDFQPELEEQALLIAHKLAGTLGIYGLHEGSRLGLKIETWLRSRSASRHTPPSLSDLQQFSTWVSQLAAELQRELPETEEPEFESWQRSLIMTDDDAALVDLNS